MSTLQPWVTSELEPPKRPTALVDEMKRCFRDMWVVNANDFQAIATSIDLESSPNGGVGNDKTIEAYLLKMYAQDREVDYPLIAAASVADLKKRWHNAARDAGKDRRSILAKREEWLALQAATEPVDWSAEPVNPDSRREAVVDSGETGADDETEADDA